MQPEEDPLTTTAIMLMADLMLPFACWAPTTGHVNAIYQVTALVERGVSFCCRNGMGGIYVNI